MRELEITKTEFTTLGNFEAWGGATSRLDSIKELEIEEEATQYIIDCLGDSLEDGTLNDFLWFEMDEFIEQYEEDEEQ